MGLHGRVDFLLSSLVVLRPVYVDFIIELCEVEVEVKKKRHQRKADDVFNIRPGLVLLSHTAARAVPSALKGLTSVFGMGTGVALSLSRPEILKSQIILTIEVV